MSLCTGKFPSYLKKANVCPIFKRGDNLDVVNYRPVSVLPNVSKIFEKVMVSQLSQYFDPLLNPNISGFRQGHSCESVLTKLVSDNTMCFRSRDVCMYNFNGSFQGF